MTKEEFLDFDALRLYEPGYEKELQYMRFLTYYVVKAAKEAPDPVGSLKYDWFGENSKYPDLKTYLEVMRLEFPWTWNPAHKRQIDFLNQYENLCKDFLMTYYNNFSEINNNKERYYTATLVNALWDRLPEPPTLKLKDCLVSDFIDFREPFAASLKNNNELNSNTKDDYGPETENKFALKYYVKSLNGIANNIREIRAKEPLKDNGRTK